MRQEKTRRSKGPWQKIERSKTINASIPQLCRFVPICQSAGDPFRLDQVRHISHTLRRCPRLPRLGIWKLPIYQFRARLRAQVSTTGCTEIHSTAKPQPNRTTEALRHRESFIFTDREIPICRKSPPFGRRFCPAVVSRPGKNSPLCVSVSLW